MSTADDPNFLILGEDRARQLLAARAIEEADPEGRLLAAAEREQLEREALAASRDAAGTPDYPRYLRDRATRLLAAVRGRSPALAALAEPDPWRRRLPWLLPLAACLLGTALDRIDNPQQVNMLSPPLLGVLFWNLAAYVLLLVAALGPARWRGAGLAGGLQRWLASAGPAGRSGRLRADVLARFHRHWLQATGGQQALWGRRLLHLTAAGWAIGMALSIVLGGLVRQYRVGWESTLLDLGQVHAFLRFLFAPVVALLPFDGFSAADLQRMAFGPEAAIGVEEARRWVWMYLALLFLVVVLPRLLLAAWAGWREARLARQVRIDLRAPYFVETLARVSPARLTLGVVASDAAGRELLQQMLRQAADQPQPPGPGPWTVLATEQGDTLRVVDLPADAPAAAPAVTPPRRGPAWMQALLGRLRPPTQADEAAPPAAVADLLLLLPARPADVDAWSGRLRQLASPAVLLLPAAGGPFEQAVQQHGLDARVLPLPAACSHWLRDPTLLAAIAGALPQRHRAGFERLAASWQERNEQRFFESMRLLARLLARAARETEELAAGPAGLRDLVDPRQREAAQRAREVAAAAVLARLRVQETQLVLELLRLHRQDVATGPLPAARADGRMVLQQPVDTRQAGMAGAGTGAAMGAGIDLAVGGITLGAAAALGAVIGGGAAYAAAAWRNRATASGRSLLQLSDDMLDSLADDVLLAYLAAAHREARDVLPPAWRSEVVAAVATRREALAALWMQARNALDEEAMVVLLARELAPLARGLLQRL